MARLNHVGCAEDPGSGRYAMARRARLGARFAAGLGAAVVLAACSSPGRTVRTEDELVQMHAADVAAAHADFNAALGRLVERVGAEESPQVEILALSGGGDKGAFGAGVLVGWGQSVDPAHRRPVFDAVSGVSTGAMQAPFAFVGTDEACATMEEFYRNPRKDWVKSRGPLFFLPSNESFATIDGLRRDVTAGLAPAFIDEIVAGSDAGRMLLVASTNIDMGTQRVWELGRYARLAQQEGDSDPVSDRLLASSSIPAAFPPVEIDGFLHTDGGVTANVLVRLDPDSPDGFLQRWRARYPERPLPRVRYWVIVNDQIATPPATVAGTWPSVLTPAIATSIRAATMAEVRWLAAQAKYVNEVYDSDIEVRLLSIPNEFRPPVTGVFIEESMRAMADVGRELGRDPGSWEVLADGRP